MGEMVKGVEGGWKCG
jgi:hypothetical protein